jgi:hypothetical protein
VELGHLLPVPAPKLRKNDLKSAVYAPCLADR